MCLTPCRRKSNCRHRQNHPPAPCLPLWPVPQPAWKASRMRRPVRSADYPSKDRKPKPRQPPQNCQTAPRQAATTHAKAPPKEPAPTPSSRCQSPGGFSPQPPRHHIKPHDPDTPVSVSCPRNFHPHFPPRKPERRWCGHRIRPVFGFSRVGVIPSGERRLHIALRPFVRYHAANVHDLVPDA